MSRTDKTAPFWVKLMRGDLATEAVHDHREGPCDLPDRLSKDLWEWPRRSRCRWEFAYTGTNVCCCYMCHGDYGWGIGPSRRRRIESKRACREWESEY